MNSKTPLVSIGLVTYNRGDIIHLAIEQLLAQTHRNIELIISDNASTDNTEQVIRSYAKKDARIRYIRQKKNIGMYANFNFVLQEARGDFFLWATDDDEWDKRFIEKMVLLLEKYPMAVVAGANSTFFSDTKAQDLIHNNPEIARSIDSIARYMYQAMFVTYGVVRTEALRKTGGFFHYPWPIPDGIGDIIPVYRLLLQGDVAYDQAVLWKKRDSGYTFDKFSLLQQWKFDRAVMMRIQRYLKFPILYFYNLIVMLQSTWVSSYSLKDKCVLTYFCIRFFVSNMVEFVGYIVQGIGALLKGFVLKFVDVRRI